MLSNKLKRHQIEQAYLAELTQDSKTSEGSPSPEHLLSIIQILEKISLALEGLAEKPRRAFCNGQLKPDTFLRFHTPYVIARFLGAIESIQFDPSGLKLFSSPMMTLQGFDLL